jgi:hypothetical protein
VNGVQAAKPLPLTHGEIAVALTRMYGEKRAQATVEQIVAREGILNHLNQCGDLAVLSCPIDGGLCAVDRGEVATRD